MTFNITSDKNVTKFDKDLGYMLWNIAVSLAPYDTGNLRRAISMNINTDKKKKIVYNALNAYYLHYLEMGEGSIKKHTGFISERTVGAFIIELIDYFKNGTKNIIFMGKPTAVLRESRHGAMFAERKILKSLNFSTDSLTGDDRRKISQIRFRGLAQSNQERAGGKQPNVKRMYRKSINKKTDMWFMDREGYEGRDFVNKIEF